VDLSLVEQAIVQYDVAFDLQQISYDPYELRYLASRLQAGKVGGARMTGEPKFGGRRKERLPMVEVPQTGKNLTSMASAVIEAFNDYRVELYEEPALMRDLKALKLEEKSYGMRLASPEQADGSHGDVGTAFALACLAASELASRKVMRVGAQPKAEEGDYDWRAALRRAQHHARMFELEQQAYLNENPHSLRTALNDRSIRQDIIVTRMGELP
jgi:hypothetical protein